MVNPYKKIKGIRDLPDACQAANLAIAIVVNITDSAK